MPWAQIKSRPVSLVARASLCLSLLHKSFNGHKTWKHALRNFSTVIFCRFFHQFRCLVVHWNKEKRCCSGKRKGSHPTFSNSEPFWSFWPFSFCRCRVLFSYQPVHDDELELKVFPTHTILFSVQVFTILLLFFRLIRILTSCVRWRMVGGRGGWEAE